MPASCCWEMSPDHAAGQRLERAATSVGWHSPRRAAVLQLWVVGERGALQGQGAEQTRLPNLLVASSWDRCRSRRKEAERIGGFGIRLI